MHRVLHIAYAVFLLWVTSCGPVTELPYTGPLISSNATFGDSLDDAAWEALGPRPAGAEPLPFEPIRLADFWQLDRWKRKDRLGLALYFNILADTTLKHSSSTALNLYLDAIRTAPLLLPPWRQTTKLLLQREEAMRAYALALQYQRMVPPDEGSSWYLLGRCQVQLDQTEEATRSLEKSIQLGSADSTEAVVTLALLYLNAGDIAAAESLQTTFGIQNPVLKILTRAKRERRAGNVRLAAELLEEAAADSSAPRGVWMELASTLVELRDFDKAEATYRQVLEKAPDKPSAVVGMARIEMAQKKFAAADRRLTTLTQQHPNNLVAQLNLGTAILEQVRQGTVEIDQLKRADDSFTRCIHANFQLEAALWGRAEARLRRNLLRTGFADAKRAQALSPTDWSSTTRWARIQLHADFEPEALRTLRNAAKLDQIDREGLALLKTLEDKTGLNTIDELRYLFRKRPEDWPTGMRLGVALMATGELGEAEEVLRAVVALQPNNPSALQNLAAVLDRRKKYREAEALLIRADGLR